MASGGDVSFEQPAEQRKEAAKVSPDSFKNFLLEVFFCLTYFVVLLSPDFADREVFGRELIIEIYLIYNST